MIDQHARTKDTRLVLRIDSEFIERLNRIAAERFEGNRSLLVREALRDLVAQYEAPQKEKAA
jgi:metal-responsive CopG/Arc/MetJ family transcriptional regulator